MEQVKRTPESPVPAVYRWLEALPPGAEVAWMSAHDTVDGVHTGWIDVEVPVSGTSTDWIWTVTANDDPGLDAGGDLALLVDYDRTVWRVWDPASGDHHAEPCTVTAAGVHPDHGWIEQTPSGYVTADGGWSPATVSAAIEQWVTTHTGRTDVRFVYDPSPSPLRLSDEVTTARLEHLLRVATVG